MKIDAWSEKLIQKSQLQKCNMKPASNEAKKLILNHLC